MIQIIDKSTLVSLKKTNSFYDFNEYCNRYGYCIQIEVEAEYIPRFRPDLAESSQAEYHALETQLINFTKELLLSYFKNDFIIAKDNEKWLINPKESIELYNFFKNNGVANNFNGGLVIRDENVLNLILEAAFRYKCFPLFMTEGSILIPTDHMDIFVFVANAEHKNHILNFVSEYKSMCLSAKILYSE